MSPTPTKIVVTLYAAFQQPCKRPSDADVVVEESDMHDDEELGLDDSEIPTREVILHVTSKTTMKSRVVKLESTGEGLSTSETAEDPDAEPQGVDANLVTPPEEPQLGRGKRVRRPNAMYAKFWRHANDRDEDLPNDTE
ncbi:hypothetical protein DFH08DRAFT_972174 [Mycena albidolilacea]|uniref:Uncharacterized protein n=1 Tax=Mycena albidolilacea TaxID=1033008 RepID=A0AAD6ZC35_9AGAR|nr:hypothetical protein DFH08DRAFT_972174 [Mycena albidolilacea]